MQRVAFFQGAAKAATGPIELEKIHSLIQTSVHGRICFYKLLLIAGRYLSRHDEELAKLKGQRRPGRPSSTREDLLKQSMATEDREYNSGFWIPDMQDEGSLAILQGWNGDWTSLNTIKYVRLSRDGLLQTSNFPPKGLS